MFSPSRFCQLIKLIDRSGFKQSIRRHSADKYSKEFKAWDHLIAMLYAQFSGFGSLRDVETSFNAHANHHYHLGMKPIRRSTLADANRRRSYLPFLDLTRVLMKQLGRRAPDDLHEMLFLIDATPIILKGHLFDEWTKTSRVLGTQGLKLHLELSMHSNTPSFIEMTSPNVNDICVAKDIPLREGATYVFDRGYCDYNWWWKISCSGCRFVTRLKRGSNVEIISTTLPTDDTILEDVQFVLKNLTPRGGKRNLYQSSLRRITVVRPNKTTPLVLVTNDLSSSATEIANLYKRRWQIELYFKWVKQNLRIKRFLGRNENAVRIQILTALIAYLLTIAHKGLSGVTVSLKACFVALKSTLFSRVAEEKRQNNRRKFKFESLQQPFLFYSQKFPGQ